MSYEVDDFPPMSTSELQARLEMALERLEEARVRDGREFQRRFEMVRNLRAQLEERLGRRVR